MFSLLSRNTKTKSQKKFSSFQADDIIILPGYPKSWEGMSLLNVRLAVRIPDGSGNDVIPHEILSTLMVDVAPEIRRRMGHGVVFIERVDVESGQASSAPPEASGRNSDEPDSGTPHKYVLIVLGVLLGVVCLVAIIIIVVFCRRKTKRWVKAVVCYGRRKALWIRVWRRWHGNKMEYKSGKIVSSNLGHLLTIPSYIEDITRWREDMNFMFEW